MNRLVSAMFGMAVTTLCSLAVSAADREQLPISEEQQRELIYCADLMTHAEREAYRARWRAAPTPQAQTALRQAHQEEMRARARERGLDPIECEPQHYRKRLRLRGGTP